MTSQLTSDTSPARGVPPDDPADEAREGPVREKLEETRIDAEKRKSLETNDTSMKEVPGSPDGRGRVRKKRSLDDLNAGEDKTETKHTRKRSRELDEKQPPSKKEKPDSIGDDEVPSIGHAQAEIDDSGLEASEPTQSEESPTPTVDTHEKQPDFVTPTTPPKVPASSGFANASAKSPFASLNASKSPFSEPKNSPNGGGFASSGFSAFAKSDASPFGALSPSKQSAPVTKEDETSAPILDAPKEKLSFTSARSQPSGFGVFGSQKSSTFGDPLGASSPFTKATAGTNSPLKSFASTANKSKANGLQAASTTTFGDPTADEEDVQDDDNDETAQVGTQLEEKRDERFYEQDLETGEEDETTIFQHRAKLYYNPGDQWKERGVGIFKVNCRKVKSESEDGITGASEGITIHQAGLDSTQAAETKVVARFVFRADGNLRMMLNSPVTREVEFNDRPGTEGGKSKIFTGYIDGKPTPCLIQMKLPSDLAELAQVVDDIKKTL